MSLARYIIARRIANAVSMAPATEVYLMLLSPKRSFPLALSFITADAGA